MVDIELQQNPQSNVDHARKVFENAVSQFGQQDAGNNYCQTKMFPFPNNFFFQRCLVTLYQI